MLDNKLRIGDWVEKTLGDYAFEGKVVAVFYKYDEHWCQGNEHLRVVVQNPDGILHIFNPKQLTKVAL